jgi:DNA-binding CsgD family transcriptional regulator
MPHKLSKREREILAWVSEGKTAWEIGNILKLSQRTVEWHLKTIREKVNCNNVTQAVAIGIRKGVIGVVGTGWAGIGVYASMLAGEQSQAIFNAVFGLIV